MNELVILKNQQAVTTSLQVAEIFEKQHKHVIEAIETKIQSAENSAHYQKMFAEGDYTDSRNRKQKMYYMNRDGFTFIAFGFTGSRADEFKLKYIEAFNQMEETLKNAQLQIPTNPMEALSMFLEVQKDTNEKVEKIEGKVTDLEENQVLGAGDYNYITRRIHQRVAEVARGFGRITSKQRGELYRDINNGVKAITGTGTRSQLRSKHYEQVVAFIQDWEPSTATKSIVRQMTLDLAE